MTVITIDRCVVLTEGGLLGFKGVSDGGRRRLPPVRSLTDVVGYGSTRKQVKPQTRGLLPVSARQEMTKLYSQGILRGHPFSPVPYTHSKRFLTLRQSTERRRGGVVAGVCSNRMRKCETSCYVCVTAGDKWRGLRRKSAQLLQCDLLETGQLL